MLAVDKSHCGRVYPMGHGYISHDDAIGYFQLPETSHRCAISVGALVGGAIAPSVSACWSIPFWPIWPLEPRLNFFLQLARELPPVIREGGEYRPPPKFGECGRAQNLRRPHAVISAVSVVAPVAPYVFDLADGRAASSPTISSMSFATRGETSSGAARASLPAHVRFVNVPRVLAYGAEISDA